MINNYYLFEEGQQIGPFSHYELMDKGVEPGTLILSPISDNWQSAADLPEFYEYFESRSIYAPTTYNLANFWWRLLAYIIDYILMIILIVAMGTLIGVTSRFSGFTIDLEHQGEAKLDLIIGLVTIFYNAGFEAAELQGSIGKIICKLKVVNAGGRRISFATALGRNFAKILSSLMCGLGFFNIFWNKQRQGWHDVIAKTYVIKRS